MSLAICVNNFLDQGELGPEGAVYTLDVMPFNHGYRLWIKQMDSNRASILEEFPDQPSADRITQWYLALYLAALERGVGVDDQILQAISRDALAWVAGEPAQEDEVWLVSKFSACASGASNSSSADKEQATMSNAQALAAEELQGLVARESEHLNALLISLRAVRAGKRRKLDKGLACAMLYFDQHEVRYASLYLDALNRRKEAKGRSDD